MRAVERFPNTRAVIERYKNCFSVRVRRIDRNHPTGAVTWARALGIWGRGAREKHLPSEVFELCNSNIALLLARLWEGDGSFSLKGHASYDTASPKLAREVQHLLLRLDIVSRLYRRIRSYKGRTLQHYTVVVTGEDLRQFWRYIGRRFLDPERSKLSRSLATRRNGRMSRDIIPADVRTIIRRERERAGLTCNELREVSGLATREIFSRGGKKIGFRRFVIDAWRLSCTLEIFHVSRIPMFTGTRWWRSRSLGLKQPTICR